MDKEYFAKRSDGAAPTLFECDSVEPGVIYNVLDGIFGKEKGSEEAYYRVDVSLTVPSYISLTGIIVDGSGRKICDVPPSSASSACRLSLEGTVRVSGEASLIVDGYYIMSFPIGLKIPLTKLTLPLTPILPAGSHKLIHPTKRKEGEPVRRYGDLPEQADMAWNLPRETGYVVTVLNRDPHDTTDIDYICCWGLKDEKYPYFGLPGKGSVTGPEHGTFLPDSKHLRATCVLYPKEANRGGGILAASANSVGLNCEMDRLKSFTVSDGRQYELAPGDITFRKDDFASNIAHYEFLGAWKNKELVYDEPEYIKYFDYELKLSLPFQVPNKTSPVVYNVIVTSRDTTSPVALIDRSVLPVKVMYGCFAKGSMVLTPDGEKAVEDIRIGDMVCTPDGESKVRNVYRGSEENLIRIETGKGRRILVTKDHPMVTGCGFVRAEALDPARHRLMTKDGPEDIISLTTEEYRDMVYNLQLDGGRLIVNGFIAGDFSAQNGED